MRVANNNIGSLISDLSRINSQQADVSKQLSTGSRITSLGSDAAAAGQSAMLASGIRTADSFIRTASSLNSRMQAADSALGSVVTAMSSAVSLAVQGSTGTLNASNKQAIAQQLMALRDQIVSLGNSSYQGVYLFSGTSGTKQPYFQNTDGSVSYAGDLKSTTFTTETGLQIPDTLNGAQAFGTGTATEVFKALNVVIGQLSSGSQVSTDALTGLRSSLDVVTAGRASLDTMMNRLSGASDYAVSRKAQLTAAQSSLISADTAELATELSAGETQRSALMSTIAVVQKGSLFDYL